MKSIAILISLLLMSSPIFADTQSDIWYLNKLNEIRENVMDSYSRDMTLKVMIHYGCEHQVPYDWKSQTGYDIDYHSSPYSKWCSKY